jgi:hypothetical protein
MRTLALTFAISLILGCAAAEEADPAGGGDGAAQGGSLSVSGSGGASAGVTSGSGASTGGTSGAATNGSPMTAAGSSNAGTNSGTAGSSGAAPGGACGKFAAATGTPVLIDDLEDGNADVGAVDGRAGGWYVSTDGTGTATPKSGSPIPEAGGMPGKAVHVSGTGLTGWGASLAASIADPTMGCYDASKFTGISVSLKGTGAVWVSVLTAGVRGAAADMRNHYKKQVTLTGEWQTVTIAFSELTQPGGWGIMVPFDASKLYGIDFGPVTATAPATTSYDFWVDNLSFK